MTDDLETRLLDAHASGDKQSLIGLYAAAAERSDDPARAAFYLTHAWVFALEADDPRANEYHTKLAGMGRAD